MQWQFCKYIKIEKKTAERHLSACRRRHADVAADQIAPLPRALTRSWCRGRSVRARVRSCAVDAGQPLPGYK